MRMTKTGLAQGNTVMTGAGRLAMADARVAQIKADAVPSHRASMEVPVAPARGQTVVLQIPVAVMTPNGTRVHVSTNDGNHPVRARHVLETPDEDARPSAQPLVNALQLETARAYATLHERVQSAGIRCSSIEALSQGSAGGGSFIDAVIADSQMLRFIEAAVGPDMVLIPRNAQAHADRRRGAVPVLTLVRMVCIEGHSLSAVLHRHGWSRKGGHRDTMRTVLCAALDRMQRVMC